MNQLVLNFTYSDIQVRTVTQDGVIWFMLRDVCDVLGIKNDTDVWNRLDEDEKAEVDFTYPSSNGVVQRRKAHFVSEPGLYDTIIRSNSERAKPFRRWVTHEVLPSIRKQGYYSLMSDHELVRLVIEKYKNNPSFLVKLRKSNIDKQIKIDEANRKFTDELLAELKADALWARSASLSREQYVAELQEICKNTPKVVMSQMIRWNKRRGTNT